MEVKARPTSRVQLTTDGHKAYLKAIAAVDFRRRLRHAEQIFATDYAGPARYSPPKCIGAIKQVIQGDPDPALVNTSFAERQNLNMRMSMSPVHATNERLQQELRTTAMPLHCISFSTISAAFTRRSGLLGQSRLA
jgi:hypothetical protein